MVIKDYFDRIYVINLPERTDRRRRIVRELDRAGLPLERGKVEIFPAVRPSSAAGFPNIGHRGCFLTHCNILKRAEAEGLRNVLIIEDDLSISPRFAAEAADLVKILETTAWGFTYFGHVERVEGSNPAALRSHVGPLLTTHFVAVHGSIFARFVAFMELVQQRPAGHPGGGPMPIDGAYSTFRRQNPDVLTLLASPNLGWQRSSRSDLSPKWFDRIPGLRQAVAATRRAKLWWQGR
jgi:hypothetical protein